MDVKFKKEDIMNLSVFLDRVPLKGKSEAVAMVDIMNSMSKSLEKAKEGEK